MSGIVAAHGPFDPRLGHRMLARLAHRGPDGAGTCSAGGAWLGHRRLAIVDLEGGGQPMAGPGGLWLVRSNSATAVMILAAYVLIVVLDGDGT